VRKFKGFIRYTKNKNKNKKQNKRDRRALELANDAQKPILKLCHQGLARMI
jgi:hypothetical protein